MFSGRLRARSVSSNKSHFETGLEDMYEIKRRYGNLLDRLITKKLSPPDFRQAFESDREDIKTVIYFS